MQIIARLFLLILFIVSAGHLRAQEGQDIVVSRTADNIWLSDGLELLEDPQHNIFYEAAIKSAGFKRLDQQTPNLGITRSAYWLRLTVKNSTDQPRLILKLSNPGIDSVSYYEPMGDTGVRVVHTGEAFPFTKRRFISSDFLFPISISPGTEKTVYLHVSSSETLVLPFSLGAEPVMLDSDKYKDIFWGMYIGLMLAMLLYNCFVYLTTKDRSYLYYIAYVLAVVITQITISGYGFQLLWPGSPGVAKYSAFLAPAFVGIAGMAFMRHFLKTKTYVPRADKFFAVFVALYLIGVVCAFSGQFNVGQNMIDIAAGSVSLFMLAIAVVISRKGYRPAIFFLIAWIVFLIGIFVFVFKNFSILPYNNFTVYTMPVGSAMEVLLLSFALADRINILKKEKEESQARTLAALKENERIIKEQNVILERKVDERTVELKLSNDELNKALQELKEAETQLVESEKMASLGQLTAGIAHEINNPINFVTSNVKPLNRDVQILLEAVHTMEDMALSNAGIDQKKKQIEEYKNDIDFDYLKIEIDQLLKGIGEGASRTAEIVKGLRIFSRLDEDDLKKADINEGLDSTLIITNNLLNNVIRVQKNYSNLPMIECYPGKLNQVFLNMISNAIYAIRKKFGEKEGGVLTITTEHADDRVIVRIADNGTGMDENTRKRLFEPFFTTKDVGEGTGLGLSIAYNTINKHEGKIEVKSELGKGTEFIIKLPLIHK